MFDGVPPKEIATAEGPLEPCCAHCGLTDTPLGPRCVAHWCFRGIFDETAHTWARGDRREL